MNKYIKLPCTYRVMGLERYLIFQIFSWETLRLAQGVLGDHIRTHHLHNTMCINCVNKYFVREMYQTHEVPNRVAIIYVIVLVFTLYIERHVKTKRNPKNRPSLTIWLFEQNIMQNHKHPARIHNLCLFVVFASPSWEGGTR